MEKTQKEGSKKRYRSAKYKVSLVLELLRGEPSEHIARREKVTLAELSSWKNTFLDSGKSGFASKDNKLEKALSTARSLIADQAMELALYKKKLQLLNTTLDT